ncbi:MAG: glycosyltransferase, partial [Actinobacteria bacterium]|nr:glycosyltransferase [Actinomycetota bacterium]
AEAREALKLQPGLPLVLSVGSIEPRKNQIMALRAAERLWNEGQEFQLLFIGWNAWNTEAFEEKVAALQAAGKHVRIVRSASDDMLSAAYRAARFSVYVSIAEGHGLHPAESLAAGTPVVLSDIGSMRETGSAGGAEMVDPRDLNGVVDAMRLLLTDDSRLAALTAQISHRPQRTWDDYAAETWDWLINGVEAEETATKS